MTETFVVVGAVLGAFGVRGEVRVKSFTADPVALARYGPLLDAAGAVILTPRAARALKDAIAVKAPEVQTREQAEALRGTLLHVPRARLPEPDEEEFYHVDLIGCAVETPTGEPLGIVRMVHDFGAGDVVEVKPEQGETLFLPFTAAVFPHIDAKSKKLIAVPPETDEPETNEPETDDPETDE